MKNTIIAILVVLVLALGLFIFNQKKSTPLSEPWPETVPANPSPTSGNPTTGTNPCVPSIVVSAPATGAAYTVGQQVTVKWTTCGVSKVSLGLGSGGKDFGMITQTPISASTGSYQWTATNPAKSLTSQNTNSYQIAVESEVGGVMAKSGVFTVTTPESVTLQCSSASPQSIKVLSPNNAEHYRIDDLIHVKFESCYSMPAISNFDSFGISRYDLSGNYASSGNNIGLGNGDITNYQQNPNGNVFIGSFDIKIPPNMSASSINPGLTSVYMGDPNIKYKIYLTQQFSEDGSASDSSDSYFTITL